MNRAKCFVLVALSATLFAFLSAGGPSIPAHAGPVRPRLPPYWLVSNGDFSRDGKLLLAWEYRGRLALWNIGEDPGPKQEYPSLWVISDSEVTTACLSPDGKRVIVAGRDDLKELDAATGKELRIVTSIPEFSTALFTPDCKRLVTSHVDYVGVRDIQTVECLHVLSMDDLPAEQWPRMTMAPDGKRLLTWVRYGPVREWDLTTGKQMRVLLPRDKDKEIRRVSFLPNGSVMRVIFSDMHLFLDARTGRPAAMPEWLTTFHDSSLRFSPDLKNVVTCRGVFDGSVSEVLETATGAVLHTLPRVEVNDRGMADSEQKKYTSPGCIVFSPDGTKVLVAGWSSRHPWITTDPDMRVGLIWDVAKGRHRGALAYPR